MAERRDKGFSGLSQAFDEVRFGATRTLNLRPSLPTGSDTSWMTERTRTCTGTEVRGSFSSTPKNPATVLQKPEPASAIGAPPRRTKKNNFTRYMLK